MHSIFLGKLSTLNAAVYSFKYFFLVSVTSLVCIPDSDIIPNCTFESLHPHGICTIFPTTPIPYPTVAIFIFCATVSHHFNTQMFHKSPNPHLHPSQGKQEI